jgi:uncharacterized protein
MAKDLLASTSHRPWPLPDGKWVLQMRWTDLLFAHWPVAATEMAPLIPAGFTLDLYDGAAWVGVVPFRMENTRLRGLPPVPGTDRFPEANIRTYVTEPKSGHPGVFFLSLDVSNPLAAAGARAWYRLPYFVAKMSIDSDGEGGWRYYSRRLFSSRPAVLQSWYKSCGKEKALPPSKPGSIEYFLTERYALFTHSRGRLLRADIHHRQWVLEPAEAQFSDLTLAAAQGVKLPDTEPLLHYSRQRDVIAWPPRTIRER